MVTDQASGGQNSHLPINQANAKLGPVILIPGHAMMADLTGALQRPGPDEPPLPALRNMVWERIEPERLRDPDLCGQLRRLMEQARDSILMHDPIWLGVGSAEPQRPPGATNEFYISRCDGRVIGYAPFTCGPKDLRFAIGELSLYQHRLRGLTLVHDIVVDGGLQARSALTRELLDLLARRLRREEGVFLEGIATDSILFELAGQTTTTRNRLLAIRLGNVFEHQFVKLPATLREYEAELGASSRQNLRRRRKKLLEHVAGDMRTERFTEEAEVPRFVADARRISQTTYQWRLLGLGLRDAERVHATLARAARNGWLRCYILYCRGKPVAFMQGYLYRGTYHYIDVGYDPAWAKWVVGSVLQMEVLRDLIEDPSPPELFDFSTGYGAHKARFGNTSRTEANLLLLRNCPRNAMLATAYRFTATVDRIGGRLLDRFGVKAQLKRWLRRAA
jgi:hypothetical protein